MKQFSKIAVVSLIALLLMGGISVLAQEDFSKDLSVEESYNFIFGKEASYSDAIKVDSNTSFEEHENGLTYGFLGIEGSMNIGTSGMADGFYFDTDKPVTNLKNNDNSIEVDYNSYDSEFIENLSDAYLPIRFSAKMEEHKYYKVTATVVNTNITESTRVTLNSEKRHFIMFEDELAPGETVTKTFNVNLESVFANNKINSDDTINICVSGKNAGLVSVKIDKMNDFGKTLWVLGDSTVCDQKAAVPYYPLRTYCGIGQFMPMYINPDIAVSNQGEGGLKAYDSNHYNNTIEHMRSGDYLYVQYGINDKNYHHDTEKFKRDLEKYYTAAHEKEVKLIIASTIDHHIMSRNWDNDNLIWKSSMSDYRDAAKEFVDEKIASGADDIAFIDINTPYIEWLNNIGIHVKALRNKVGYSDEKVSPLAVNYYYTSDWSMGTDTTHTNDAGADNAAFIAFNQVKSMVDYADSDGIITKIDAEYNENGSLKEIHTAYVKNSEYKEVNNKGLNKTFYWIGFENIMPYQPKNISNSEKLQASVLSELIKNSDRCTPYEVKEKDIKAGWVPNSLFPKQSGKSEYEYPLNIESVDISEGKIVSIKVKVQGSMGYYAQGVAEIYNGDNEKVSKIYTTEHIDNTAAGFGNEYILYFDTESEDNVLNSEYSFKIYMRAEKEQEEVKYSEEYVDSYMRTVDLKLEEEGSGILYGAGKYPLNSEVIISVEPTNSELIFEGWYNEDNTLYSSERVLVINNIKTNLILTAKFEYPSIIVGEADFEDGDFLAKTGILSGNGTINETRGGELFGKMVQLNDGANLILELDNSVERNVKVEFDAYYMSNENGKYSYIQLKNDNGDNLADVKFSRYTSSGCYIRIGGNTVYSGNAAYDFIRDGKINGETVGNCSGVNVDYAGSKEMPKTPLETTTHITIGINTQKKTAYIEFRSNTNKDRYSIVSGNISSDENVKSLFISSDFSEEKAMWVDNIKISASSK